MGGLFSFFANPAEPEDQGGFCDAKSGVHYCNESNEQMKNSAAVHSEHSGNTPDIRGDDEDADRYNTTILEVDRLHSEHPARHAPGR